MKKKRQTRGAVSLTGRNYRRLKVYAEEQGVSMSAVLEMYLDHLLGDREDPDPGWKRRDRERAASANNEASRFFPAAMEL